MTEKPIIFSGEMIKAIIEVKKTQERHVIKPQPTGKYCPRIGKDTNHLFLDKDSNFTIVEPKYQAGDILYVRETWMPCATIDSYLTNTNLYAYKADYVNDEAMAALKKQGAKWRSPIHMPREAARIFLRVTGVRVERLQDITAEDCRAEGISVTTKSWNDPNWSIDPPSTLTEKRISNATGEPFNEKSMWWREWYRELWDSINAKRDGGEYAWGKNPWVFVYEFERAEL